jgi:spore maturation protein CgeB
MRILCVFGRHNYGDPARGEGVEHAHFLPAFQALGHETEHFESFARAGHADFAALNRALLERVEAWRPDVVFTVLMMAEVWLETIALMRASGARVVNWATDDSWKYAEFSRLVAPAFDVFATTCPDAPAWYARDGIDNCVLTQWAAASGDLAAPKRAVECAFDVTFVGSNYGSRPARVERLRSAGIQVECFGHGWPNGAVAAHRLREIVRDSRVSLNFSEAGGGSGRQIKARVFEVPGAGGMLLTERAPHMERYFSIGGEIACFDGEAGLLAGVRHLLAHPQERDAIAAAGFERVVREHTYERRLAALLERAMTAAARPWAAMDWPAFERLAGVHETGPGLRVSGAFLRRAFSLVWGAERGPRAARRALFEASWRLVGRHTYTAAGWPGRLFYRES